MDTGGKFPAQPSVSRTKGVDSLRLCSVYFVFTSEKSRRPFEGSDAKFGLDRPHADPGRADSEPRALVHMQAPKLLPLLQPESDYRQAWGQAGHWKHRHEQTIRYYLKESSAFQRKMVPLSVTLTIGSSTWHWISHLRRMNTATHSCLLAKIMRALFSPLFNAYKGKFMRLYKAEILKHAAEFTMNGYWMNNSIVFPSFILMFVPITQLSPLLFLTTSLSQAFTLVIYTLHLTQYNTRYSNLESL